MSKKILTVLMLVVSSIFVLNASAIEIKGSADVNVYYDNNAENDLDVNLNTLNVYTETDNYYAYSTYNFLNEELFIDEAFAKFNLDGLDVRVGRFVQPSGINYMYRPENSVFISSPKDDVHGDGVMVTNEGFVTLDGYYTGNESWGFRVSKEFFNGGIKPIYSFGANHQSILSNEMYYQSLLFAVSNLTEWNVDSGYFWNRTVVYPGIIDEIGIMLAYYNTDINTNVPPYDFSPDAWTVGAYLDVSENTSVSYEYSFGEDFTPAVIKITSKF